MSYETDLVARLRHHLQWSVPYSLKPLRDAAKEAADLIEYMTKAEPVAWRVRGYAQFKTGAPGPWRYVGGPKQPEVTNPEACDMEPLYAHPAAPAPDAEAFANQHVETFVEQYNDVYCDQRKAGVGGGDAERAAMRQVLILALGAFNPAAPAPDDARERFERWWYASKYMQVVISSPGKMQLAWDAWQAAMKDQP